MSAKKEGLPIWTVYDHPKDFPDSFVARLYVGQTPTATFMSCPDLDMLRGQLAEMGLVPLARSEGDDPVIVEVWL
ncbi:hypothetical protein [Allomesorhizobium camelthorni]|uniref:Uncharacterized protein n=1 Tax=Allomesorhizobium camelthorni TaxID=475069 RepID=A0A6G4WIG6_9HYPH|nr:hypothetical protein [Mesorhizobium camelthorni]NGO54551.1 hypothetical protein [Mesorhizobium camelthorni]